MFKSHTGYFFTHPHDILAPKIESILTVWSWEENFETWLLEKPNHW